jgi:HTH-type transcriptional regulator, cell division transcriptional repressor
MHVTDDQFISSVIPPADPAISPAARGARLQRLRTMADLSRKAMQFYYGINMNTLKGWELGRYGGLSEQGACKLLPIFHVKGVQVSLDWLLYRIGIGPCVIAEQRKAGQPTAPLALPPYPANNAQIKQIIKELLYFRSQHQHVADFMVEDDGMAPNYVAGDYLAGIKCYGQGCEVLVGHDCIVQPSLGKVLLRRIYAVDEQGLFTLGCTNAATSVKPVMDCQTGIISAAPVIWLRRQQGMKLLEN